MAAGGTKFPNAPGSFGSIPQMHGHVPQLQTQHAPQGQSFPNADASMLQLHTSDSHQYQQNQQQQLPFQGGGGYQTAAGVSYQGAAVGGYQRPGGVATSVNSAGHVGSTSPAVLKGIACAEENNGEQQADGNTTQQLLELLGSDSGDSVVSADSFGEPYDREVGMMQRRVTAV